MSPAEAAYEAGYKTRARKAAAEMRNPKYFPLVVKYIGELRAEIREKYGITFERHVSELAQIRNKTLENKQHSKNNSRMKDSQQKHTLFPQWCPK